VRKPEGKKSFGRPRRRWKCNIKVDLKEIRWESMKWIDLERDGEKLWAYANAIMNIRVPENMREVLTR